MCRAQMRLLTIPDFSIWPTIQQTEWPEVQASRSTSRVNANICCLYASAMRCLWIPMRCWYNWKERYTYITLRDGCYVS